VGAADTLRRRDRGVTYQHKAFDLGFFDKRIGTFYIDNGAYHNQATIAPFNLANMFFNYTIRSGGRFDQTKLRLSFNNLFNSSAITGGHHRRRGDSRKPQRQRHHLHRPVQHQRSDPHQRRRQRHRPILPQHHLLGDLRLLAEAVGGELPVVSC